MSKKWLIVPLILIVFGVLALVSGLGFVYRSVHRMIVPSGMEYTIRVETTEADTEALVNLVVRVLESKLDALGADGDVTRVPGTPDQLTVKVYQGSDLEPLKHLLFSVHNLELRKVVSPPNPSPVQEFATEDSARVKMIEGTEVLSYNDDYYGEPRFMIVEKAAIINGEDIRDASAFSISESDGDYSIMFNLKPDAAERFGKWTGRNIGNYIAIVLDKKVQSAAYIRGQILDSGQIDGRFTKASAEEIALSLKSGYLPAKLIVVDEKPFGN